MMFNGRRIFPWLPRLACAAAVAIATRAAAQDLPDLPPCDPGRVEEAPCRASYDTAPVLEAEPARDSVAGESRSPLVWLFVDASGAVRRAQVHHPAALEWDVAARDRALTFRFRPASLAGTPVAAWVLMPVRAVPPPASCADASMSVPLSAGAVFVDSTVLGRPSLGTLFRYAADEFAIDLFVYPRAEGDGPREQVDRVLAVEQAGAVQGGPSGVRVIGAGPERVRLSGRFHATVFDGYGARYRGWMGAVAVESYVAVFPAGGEDLKVRATYPPTGGARRQVREFVEQILSHRARRMSGCPR